MAHPLFGPELRLMLAEDDDAALAEVCDALHPATIAETLAEDFTVEEGWRVLKHTTLGNQAAIFEYFPPEWQVEMVAGTGRPHMAQLVEEMSSDDRADLLRRLGPQVAEALLRLVDEADRRDIAQLTRYGENTAGALMTTDYAWLPDHVTAGDALERLRLQAPDTETIYYVYVVNDQRQLLGVVSLRDLILKPRPTPIQEVMETQVVSVKATDDRERLAREMARFDLIAMPVVDDDGRLVGIVTHDDVIDVVVEEATEDAHKMGGVGPIEENYLEAGVALVWRRRAVWLAFLFVGGLFTFSALEAFEDAIAEVVVLSLFVPLVISSGGNTGSQAATLITRSLSLGQVTGGDWPRVLRHEVVMGVLLGLTLGVLGFLRASFTPADVRSSAPARHDTFTVTVDRRSRRGRKARRNW
jgi:magnesium transporter